MNYNVDNGVSYCNNINHIPKYVTTIIKCTKTP